MSGTQEVIPTLPAHNHVGLSVNGCLHQDLVHVFYFFFIAVTNNAWISLEVYTCDDKNSLFFWGVQGSLYIVVFVFNFWPHPYSMWDLGSLTKYRTLTLCIGRQSLNP